MRCCIAVREREITSVFTETRPSWTRVRGDGIGLIGSERCRDSVLAFWVNGLYCLGRNQWYRYLFRDFQNGWYSQVSSSIETRTALEVCGTTFSQFRYTLAGTARDSKPCLQVTLPLLKQYYKQNYFPIHVLWHQESFATVARKCKRFIFHQSHRE